MNVNACEGYQDRLLDLIEDELEPDFAARVRAHLAACPECQAHYDWLVGATTDLNALGDALVAAAPAVDLVDAVMQAVEEADRLPNVIPLARRRRGINWRLAAGLAGAAAAAVLVLAWFQRGGDLGFEAPGGVSGNRPAVAQGSKPVKPRPEALQKLQSSREALAKLEPIGRPQVPRPEKIQATAPPDLQTVTAADVIRARRNAVSSEDARAQLVRWATLTRDKARQVLQQSDASAATIVGAAESLDAREASEVLLTAVGHYPDNPLVRFETAAKLAEQTRPALEETSETPAVNPLLPKGEASGPAIRLTLEQVQAWANLDPGNALPYYLQAEMLLRNGDLDGALETLRQAQQMSTANVYTLASAQAREEALTAGGVPADTAHLLAALTAGNNEYNFLYTLSNDLLDYGRAYAEQNYLSEAQRIFESVAHLGEQVASGADFSLVQSAGLYAQQQALLGLQDVNGAMGSEESISEFQTQTMQLLMQIEELNRYVNELNALFSTEDLSWDHVADAILQGGDLNLFAYLAQTGQ